MLQGQADNFFAFVEQEDGISQAPTLSVQQLTGQDESHLIATACGHQLQAQAAAAFEALQRDYIIKVLDYTNWRVSGVKGAATILDMKAKTLFAKMKRLGIEKQVMLKQ